MMLVPVQDELFALPSIEDHLNPILPYSQVLFRASRVPAKDLAKTQGSE